MRAWRGLRANICMVAAQNASVKMVAGDNLHGRSSTSENDFSLKCQRGHGSFIGISEEGGGPGGSEGVREVPGSAMKEQTQR